jgi:CRISP-associated protein Cas1
MIIYLTEQGSYIKRAGQRLLIVKEKETLSDIPVFKIKQILLFGNITVTPQALNLLLENGIDVAFLSMRGRIKGRLMSAESKNIYLRLAQYNRWNTVESRVRIGRSIVQGKIRTQRMMLENFARRNPDSADGFHSWMTSIEGCLKKAEEADTIDSIRGCEGLATSLYFKGFGQAVKGEFYFGGRQMYPSTDPVNALLSLTYTCLTNELASYVEARGFDPMIGFVHGIKYGRQSLALDLVEEYRHAVGDSFVLNLINYKKIKLDDFERREKGALYLNEESAKRYFGEWEKCRQDAGGTGKSLSDLIKKQMGLFEKAILKDRCYEGIWEEFCHE